VRSAGCAEAQGYYFDNPRPAAVLQFWYTEEKRKLLTAA